MIEKHLICDGCPFLGKDHVFSCTKFGKRCIVIITRDAQRPQAKRLPECIAEGRRPKR